MVRSESLIFRGDILESIIKLPREEQPPNQDICGFIVLYECFALLYNQSAQAPENFRLCLRGIRIVDCKKLEAEKCHCFSELIKSINQRQQNRDHEIISLLLDEFSHNSALDKEFYPKFLGVLRDAATSGQPVLVDKMKAILFDILESRYQIIDYEKIHDLMVILQPFVTKLNATILRILAFLSNEAVDHLLTDVFLQIPSSLVQVISDQRRASNFAKKQVVEPNYQIGDTLKMEFMDSGFDDDFEHLPFDALNESVTIWDLIQEPSREAVASVLEFLKACSYRAKEVFVETSKHLIKAVEGQDIYAELMSCLIWLFQFSLDENLVKAIMPELSTTGVFCGNDSIFHENSLDPVTNALRTSIFDLVAQRGPRLISNLLEFCRKKPFVVAEFFVRVFRPVKEKIAFEIRSFCNDESVMILFESIQILRSLPSSDSTRRAMSSLFIAVHSMVFDYGFFENNVFSTHFLWNMFDMSLRRFVIVTWRNHLATTCCEGEVVHAASYLRRVIEFCLKEKQESLASDLSEAMVSALRSNMTYANFFRPAVPVLLDTVLATGNREILINAMNLFIVISFSPQFRWSMSLGKKLLDAIERTDGDEPLSDVQDLLFCLWTRSFAWKVPFLIQQPMALTLIVAAFGRSSSVNEILDIIESLMNYSYHNIDMVHEGLLDLIFAKYLTGNSNVIEISKDLSFRFMGDVEQCRRMFSNISLVKSSAAVLDTFINDMSGSETAEFFVQLLAKSRVFGENPQFPIGTMPHQFHAYRVKADDLNHGFTVSFQLAADPPKAALQKYNATIFCLTDSEENELRVAYDREVIIGQVTANGMRTTVNIMKNLTEAKVLRFVLSFKFMDDFIRISTMMNGQTANDSDLCAFNFAEGEVKVTVGGIASTEVLEGAYSCCGVVSDIVFYTGAHAVALINDGAIDVDEYQLLSSNVVKLPSVLIQRYFMKSPSKFSDQEVVIQTQESMAAPCNLLRTAIRADSVNLLAKKVSIPGVLSAMEFLFQIDESTQKKFNSLNVVFDQLTRVKLDYSWYLQVFHVMNALTLKELRMQWFESFPFNLWLWKECEAADLKHILNHWNIMLINTYGAIFEEKKYLSMLLHDFRIFFDVVVADNGISESSECLGGVLGTKYSQSDVRECRELYLSFMSKVASISITETDLSVFFIEARNCKSKEILLCLLGFLSSISEFFRPDAYYDDLNSLLCGDPEIDEAVLIAICRLAKQDTYQRLLHVHSMVSGNELFERLLGRIQEYPGLLPVVCMMVITLQSHNVLVEKVLALPQNAVSAIVESSDWFCYLFMIAFSLEGDQVEYDICRVVAVLMQEHQLKQICAFLQVVTYGAYGVRPNIVKKFLMECVNAGKTSELGCVSFDCSLFHFVTNSYHRFVLDAIALEGIISDCQIQPHPVFCKSMKTLSDLKNLLAINTKNIHIHFELRLDNENHEWLDKEMAIMAKEHIPDGLELKEHFLDVIAYFANRTSMEAEARDAIAVKMDEFLQSECQRYALETEKILEKLFATLRNSLKLIGEREPKVVDTRREWERMIKTEFERLSKPVEIPTITFVRDNAACILYSPMKLKRHPNLTKRRVERFTPATSLFECMCMRVKKLGESRATFILTRDCFLINGKPISLNEIRIILTRKRANDETALEFWTIYGKAILLDFAPVKSSVILSKLDKVEMKYLAMKQTQKANELFENCMFTMFWKKGLCSNFDYVMRMNVLSGRSYNDRYLYPIFPAVLSHFDLQRFSPMSFPSSDLLPAMSGTETKSSILSPEYYFMPSFFDGNYEFVYKHRKALESEQVSKKLHVFIDRFFGCNMKNDFPHRKLFTKSHEHKVIPQFRCESRKKLHIFKDKTIVYATLTSALPGDIEVNALSSDGQSYLLNFKLDEQITVTGNSVEKDLPTSGSVISSANRYVLLFDKSRFEATLLKRGKLDHVVKIPSETELATCYDFGWVLYCLNRTSIWLRTDAFLKALHHFSSPVRFAVPSPAFKICVVATLDGHVFVYSMNNESTVKTATFDEEITHVVITERFGFIVVFTQSTVNLLSVNGDLIKTVPFRFSVAKAFAFASFSDFDYVVVETEERELAVFEAFYPDKVVVLGQVDEDIVGVFYAQMKTAFIVIMKSGTINIIPDTSKFINVNCV